MAAKDLNIARNSYRASLNNESERSYIGDTIRNDPWYKKQDIVLQQYLDDVLIAGGDDNTVHLGIAIINRQGISGVLENANIIVNQEAITPYEVRRGPNYYEKNHHIEQGYRSLNEQGFFSNLLSSTKHIGTSMSLAYENNAGYQIHQTTKQMMDGLENILEQNGLAVGWDLETTGGVNVGARNIGQHITEFSFIKKNLLGDSTPQETFSSVIGATEQEYQEYLDIINKYEQGASDSVIKRYGGTPISAEERVTAKRLAKMGMVFSEDRRTHGGTIDWGNNGVINFKKFVGSNDIALMDPSMMRKGAEFLREVGKRQKEAGTKLFTLGQNKYNVYGWEAELLKGLYAIQHGGTNGEALTAVGHNTMTFDISVLNRLFNSDKISSGAKEAYKVLMPEGLSFDYNLDTITLARRFLPKDFYNDNDLQQMERLGLTENQQESIVRRLTAYVDPKTGIRDWSKTVYDDPRNAGAAHMAITDVLRNLEMTESLVFKDNALLGDTLSKLIYDKAKEPIEIKGGSRGLFFARSHLDEKRYNLLQFTHDALSGEIRTADDIAMSVSDIIQPDGTKKITQSRTVEQLFGQYGMQKGVTYQVNRLFNVTTDSNFHNIMRDMYPNLDIDHLTVMELQAYTPDLKDKSVPVRAKSPIYYVGYKQDIANAMMDNTFFVGELKDDQINTDNISDFVKQQLTKKKRNVDGFVESEHFDINKVIADGAKRAEQEAAARAIRQHSYSKDQKLLNFIGYEDSTIRQLEKAARLTNDKDKAILRRFLGTENEDELRQLTDIMLNGTDEAKREVFHKRLWENSVKISKDLALGNPVKGDELRFTYNAVLGFKDNKTGVKGNLYSETLTAQIGRLGWARQNQELLRMVTAKAETLAGGKKNRNALNYYYNALLQGVEDYVETEASKNSARLGWQLDGVYSYEFDRKFDIDLSGYRGLPKGTVVSLNLESRPENMVNAIIKAAKGELFSERDYTATERGAILRDIQRHLYQTGQIGHFTDNVRGDKRAQFIADVLNDKTGYSQQFKEEFISQLDPSQPNPYRIKEGDSAAVASYKLLHSLQNKRETGDFVGHLSPTYRHFADVKQWEQILPDTKTIETVLNEVERTTHHLSGIFSVDPKDNRRAVVSDDILNDVVDNVLMDKRISEHTLEQAGYVKEDITALQQIRSLHREGLKKYTRTLFEMVGNIGGQVGWHKDSRTVFAIIDGTTVDLDMPTEIFIDGQAQYRVGPSILSIPIGLYDQKGGFRGQHELKMTSLLEKAVNINKGLIDWYERQALLGNGSKRFYLEKAMWALGKVVREAPAATEIGLASRGNQFKVQYKDIASNLPTLLGNNSNIIDTFFADESHKKILKDLASGKIEYDTNHPAYEHFLAVQANVERLMHEAYVQNIIDRTTWDNVMSNFTADVKGAAKMEGQASAHGDFYTRFNGMKRNAPGIEDATKLNVSKIAELRDQFADLDISAVDNKDIVEEFEGLRDVGIGKGITDEASYKLATVGSIEGRKLNTHVQLNALHATPMSLNALVMSNMGVAAKELLDQGDEISRASMNLLATMMPDEGTGYMHGHIFDRIFSERDTIQKLGLRKIIDNDGRTILELQKKAAAMPFFDIKGGEFHYGEGSFVTERDIIGHVEGFGLSPHGERAKYEGLLKLGAFDLSSGHLVEEAEISRVIKESLDIDDFKQLSEDKRAQKIVDLLEQKYNLAYYVQTEKANPLVKIAEMAEKGMVRGLILNTGEADERIAKVMGELGFYGGNYVEQEAKFDDSGKLIQKQITKTLGKVDALDIKMIDDLKKGNLGAFGVAAKGRYKLLHGEDLSDQKIQDIIKDAGFSNVNDFRSAIIHERYQPTRLMSTILQKSGIYATDEVFHMITNHLDNMKKHGDISAYRYLTDEWIKQEDLLRRTGVGLSEEQTAAFRVKKYLLAKDKGFNRDVNVERKGDSIILSEAPTALEDDIRNIRNAYLETDLVKFSDKGQRLSEQQKQAVREKYLDTGNLQGGLLQVSRQVSKDFTLGQGVFEGLANEQGKFIGQYEKARTDASRVGHYWDWAKETYDAAKFNQRAITALSNIRADEHGKENVRRFLDERAKAYGGEGLDIYDTYIKDLKKGEIVPSAAVDQIYRNMFNRQGGGEKLSGFINTDTAGNLVWGIDEGAVKRFVHHFDIAHGDEQKGVNIMTSLLGRLHQGLDGRSITTVNEKGAFNLWRAFSATAANSINTGVIDTPAAAERLGFKTIKLDDLLTGKIGAGDFDESLYGHNWLIDLGDHPVFKDDLWLNAPNNRSGRYVAIAADHVEDPGAFREAIVDKPQEKVKKLKENIERYLASASEEGFQGSDARKEALQKIYQNIQEIKDAQINVWKGKGGIMAQATQAWMHDASRATASGINPLGTENVGKVIQIDNLQNLMAKVEEERAVGAAVDISQLKINGISLVDEAKKGKHALKFNYSILSLERMNKIYDQGFGAISDTLVNAGVNKGEVDKLISQMSSATKLIAQTEGVEGVSAREPLQYYGSVTQRKIFFNSLASGNEAIGDFVGAQMRKEDYDSDAVVNALHKEQAELSVTMSNGNTKKVAIEVDSAMLAALNSQQMKDAGVSIRLLDTGAQERFRNYQVSQFFTAAGEAQRYRTIADFSGGYNYEPLDSLNFEDLAKKLEPFDEQITKKVLPSNYMSLGERRAMQQQLLRDVYRDMLKTASMNPDVYGADFFMASGETQRLRLLEQMEKDTASAGTTIGSGGIDLRYEALRFSFHDEQLAGDLLSAAGRVPTGKVNRYTQNMYDVVHEVLHNAGPGAFPERDIGVLTGQLNLVNLAMQEGFLSPKNTKLEGAAKQSAQALQSELMPKLEKAYRAVFDLSDTSTAEERKAAKEMFSNAMLDVVLQRSTKEIHRDPTLPTLQELLKDKQLLNQYGVNYQKIVTDTLGKAPAGTEESILEQTARKAVNNIVDFIVDDIGWNGNSRKIFSFGTSNSNGNSTNKPIVLPRESAQAPIQLNALIGDAMEDLGVSRGILLSEPIGKRKSTGQELDEFAARTVSKKNPSVDVSSVPKESTENIASLKNEIRKWRGRSILGAAVGIAGGLMISGFANNPSKRPLPPNGAGSAFGNTPIPNQSLPDSPTQMAANGAAVTQQSYPSITLSDSNLNVQRGASQKAYVINISGASPRGERVAIDAVQSSIAGPIPQNSSINIAMNNNYTDTLSQAQVGRMVQTAMGF